MVNQSAIAAESLDYSASLFGLEQDAAQVSVDARLILREEHATPMANDLHGWLQQKQMQAPAGSATDTALDCSLRRRQAITHYLTDGRVPTDNNWIENQIRPNALGRKNWLFAGSLPTWTPQFAKLSIHDGLKVKIAPVHSDPGCGFWPLSLMGFSGWRLDRLHALWVPRPAWALPTTA